MVVELLPQGPFLLKRRQLQGISKTNPDGISIPGGQQAMGAAEIAEKMYVHRYSKPRAVCMSQNCPAHEVIHEEGENMAQGKL